MAFNISTNVGEREAFICGLALSGGLDKTEQIPYVGIVATVIEPVIIPVTSIINVGIVATVIEPVIIPVTSIINDNITATVQIN